MLPWTKTNPHEPVWTVSNYYDFALLWSRTLTEPEKFQFDTSSTSHMLMKVICSSCCLWSVPCEHWPIHKEHKAKVRTDNTRQAFNWMPASCCLSVSAFLLYHALWPTCPVLPFATEHWSSVTARWMYQLCKSFFIPGNGEPCKINTYRVENAPSWNWARQLCAGVMLSIANCVTLIWHRESRVTLCVHLMYICFSAASTDKQITSTNAQQLVDNHK